MIVYSALMAIEGPLGRLAKRPVFGGKNVLEQVRERYMLLTNSYWFQIWLLGKNFSI